MPRKTITNNSFIVIFLACLSPFLASCHRTVIEGGKAPNFDPPNSVYGKVEIAGRVESDAIKESSGIAPSHCLPDVLWTHNDSGDGPFIFAMDTSGRGLGTWRVSDAENLDWEDIASFRDADGRCYLYIGDTGNRKKDPRTEHRVYRVAEPKPAGDRGAGNQPADAGSAEKITFSYPDEPQDAETLLVHPQTGDIYIVTKQRNKPAGVYRIKPVFGPTPVQAEKVSELTVPAVPNGFVTGGDISPDGSRVVICDYFAAYEFVLPQGSVDFDVIWKQKPSIIDLGDREQGEAIGYSADGQTLYATSEGENQPLLRVKSQNHLR